MPGTVGPGTHTADSALGKDRTRHARTAPPQQLDHPPAFDVVRLGPSPLPDDERRCVYLAA